MSTNVVKRGDTFTHNTLLDPDWEPSPGQSYRESPKAPCVVTAVRKGAVYFSYSHNSRGYIPVGDKGFAYLNLDAFLTRYGDQCVASRTE